MHEKFHKTPTNLRALCIKYFLIRLVENHALHDRHVYVINHPLRVHNTSTKHEAFKLDNANCCSYPHPHIYCAKRLWQLAENVEKKVWELSASLRLSLNFHNSNWAGAEADIDRFEVVYCGGMHYQIKEGKSLKCWIYFAFLAYRACALLGSALFIGRLSNATWKTLVKVGLLTHWLKNSKNKQTNFAHIKFSNPNWIGNIMVYKWQHTTLFEYCGGNFAAWSLLLLWIKSKGDGRGKRSGWFKRTQNRKKVP